MHGSRTLREFSSRLICLVLFTAEAPQSISSLSPTPSPIAADRWSSDESTAGSPSCPGLHGQIATSAPFSRCGATVDHASLSFRCADAAVISGEALVGSFTQQPGANSRHGVLCKRLVSTILSIHPSVYSPLAHPSSDFYPPLCPPFYRFARLFVSLPVCPSSDSFCCCCCCCCCFVFYLHVFVSQGEEESPLTRTIRLTAALVLRNIAQYSAAARRLVAFPEEPMDTAQIRVSVLRSPRFCVGG